MKKIKINLENCYGIKKLKKEFDFSSSKTFVIYAPNGTMKTSFAKTFIDLSNGEDSEDLIFLNKVTVREIKKEDDSNVAGEEVFVVESYNEDYKSEKMSTLLVNKELKNKYDEIHKKIDKAKDDLLKKLKQLSKLKKYTNIEEEISKSFSGKNFFDVIEEMETEIFKGGKPKFASIIYSSIFNERALDFLKTEDFKNQIKEYIEKYNELLDKSKYLKKGFNHYKALAVQKNLKENAFFKAQHSVNLYNEASNQEVTVKKDEDFENIIQDEKNNILNDKDLLKKWEEIDKKLSANIDLRSLRDYLFENKEVLPELENLEKFAQEIWISYFINQKDLYENLLREYKNGKVEIGKIVIEAKKQKTDWKEVVKTFNRRFFSPLKLKIENQDDVILKGSVPVVEFIFEDKDSGKNIQVEKDMLQKALSSGEQRALYILNIIFEVQARKKSKQETLFIVDDIVESFDYKNKYAIIQYLKEISEEPIFYQLILTHNFDFFRTLENRKVANYPNCFFSYKTESEIKLEKAKGIKNPFINDWKNDLTDLKKLIASIPFVRNLIEYTKGEDNGDYKKLTSLLHWKNDSEFFLMSSLKEIFESTITDINFPTNNLTDKVIDKIFEEAKNCLATNEGINFENKIVLSIAIRLKAEKFMIDKVNDPSFASSIDTNQTFKLFKRYKDNNLTEIENLKILEEVILMTPGNIHLNSFMYEPILDMSDQHLKSLYDRLKGLK
jgi:hypothetical protein